MNKGKGINNLKYFFFSLFLFFVVSLFLFPKSTFAVVTDCYVGDTKVGYLKATSSGWEWLVSGMNTWINFFDFKDIDDQREVFFRVGGSPWFSPSFRDASGYWGSYVVGDEPCGNCWINVTWRSVLDGKMHYCSQLLKKYTLSKSNFINRNCLSTQAGCSQNLSSDVKRVLLNPNARTVYWKDDEETCSTHKPYFYNPAGNTTGRSYYAGANVCYGEFYNPQPPSEISGGEVIAKLDPLVSPESFLWEFQVNLFLFNYISNTTCGSGYSGGVPPTPTPTPVSCPLAIQSMSFLGSGTPLINDYNTTQYKGSPQYTVVNNTKTGKVTKAEIYGTLDRDIPKGGKVLQCKITNSTGITTLGESDTNNGAFKKGVSWMGVPFTTPVSVVNGISYRLYCKVNNVYGGGLIYWLDNCWNRTDKAYRLYLCD